jgi:hypothetical protein
MCKNCGSWSIEAMASRKPKMQRNPIIRCAMINKKSKNKREAKTVTLAWTETHVTGEHLLVYLPEGGVIYNLACRFHYR